MSKTAFAKGNAYFRKNKLEEAVKEYKKSLGINGNYFVYENLGMALALLGKYDEATQAFEKSLAKNDRCCRAKAYLEKIRNDAIVNVNNENKGIATERKSQDVHPVELIRQKASEIDVKPLKLEYVNKGLHRAKDTFCLVRIIGNDLFPRHKIGQSRENLRFILENEPDLNDCEKYWVVNRIVDEDERGKILELLKKHNQKYIEIEFKVSEYSDVDFDFSYIPSDDYFSSNEFTKMSQPVKERLLTSLYRKKNNYVMNNNGARNVALKLGKTKAKWILPWDGNCFVTEESWQSIVSDIVTQPHFKYFAVPMARITSNESLLERGFVPDAREEPQIVFRSDTQELFNEDYSYGRRPKVEMFWRLAIPGVWDKYRDDPWDPGRRPLSDDAWQFSVAGWTTRLFSGMSTHESQDSSGARNRNSARQQAIIAMLDLLDLKLLINNALPEELIDVKTNIISKIVPSNDLFCSKSLGNNENNLDNKKVTFLVRRSDGLGERMRAILNGLYLSELFNQEFKFVWPMKSGVDKGFHDIEFPEKIFAKDFLEKHLVCDTSIELSRYIDLSNNKLNKWDNLQDILKRGFDGFLCHQTDVEAYLRGVTTSCDLSIKDVFNKINFSEDVEVAVSASKNVPLDGNAIAIHIRGGDIIYGRYRLFERFQRKAIPVLVAIEIAKTSIDKGSTPVIFAQDKHLLTHFDNVNGIVVADNHVEQKWTRLQKTMFEMVLMSRCDSIISGSSGFSSLAAKLSGRRISKVFDYYTAHELSDIINKNIPKYDLDSYQEAFCRFMYVSYGGDSLNFNQIESSLKRASDLDPDNGLYAIKRTINFLNQELHDCAESVLSEFISRESNKSRDKFAFLHSISQANKTIEQIISEFDDLFNLKTDGFPCLTIFKSYLLYLIGNKKEGDLLMKGVKCNYDLDNTFNHFVVTSGNYFRG